MREQNQERLPKLAKGIFPYHKRMSNKLGGVGWELLIWLEDSLDVSQQVVSNIELCITCLSWGLFLSFFNSLPFATVGFVIIIITLF